jgi:hypothetical protein
MRVLVVSGPQYDSPDEVTAALDRQHRYKVIRTLILTGMSGAGAPAATWAKRHKAKVVEFRADWSTLNGGVERNQRVFDEGKPDLMLAFPGRRSVSDMKNKARKAGVPIIKAGGIVEEQDGEGPG